MSHIVREGGTPRPIAANGTLKLGGNHLVSFICVTGGTLTVQLVLGNPTTAPTTVTVLDTFPVTAGVVYPLLFTWPSVPEGCIITLDGGAKGTIVA